MADDLKIKITMDSSPALAIANAFRADLRKLNEGITQDAKVAAAKELADVRQSTLTKKTIIGYALADEVRGHKAATDSKIADTARLRDAFGRFVKAGDDAKASFAGAGTSGVAAFANVAMAIPGVLQGMSKLKQLADVYLDAVKEAGDRMRAQGVGVLSQLEQLGRVAGLQGKTADTAFVLDQAKLRARTLLTREESASAQEAFANSGQQFIGKGEGRVSAEVAQKAFEKTAALGVAKKFDAGTMADITGRIMGMRDFSKDPDAADTIASLTNQTMSVLEAGGGDAPLLAKDVAKISGMAVNQDTMRGSFKSPVDVAKLISVMNEVSPGQEAESTRAAMKAMRDFDNPIIKEAGIVPSDDMVASLKKLAPVLEKKAKAGPAGTTIKDVIGQSFSDEQGKTAIAGLVNKGIYGGMFKSRDETAAANAGPEAVARTVREFRASERGVMRKNVAREDLFETEKGAQVSKIGLLEAEAEADLAKSKTRDSVGNLMFEKLIKWGTIGAFDIRSQTRDNQMSKRLWARMGPEARAKYDTKAKLTAPTDPAMRAAHFNRMIADIEGEGGSAITGGAIAGEDARGAGVPPPVAAGAGAAAPDPLMIKQNEILMKIAAGLGGGMAAAPRPLIESPKVLRR